MYCVVYALYGSNVHVYGPFSTHALASKWIGENAKLMGRDVSRYSVHRFIPARP